MDIPWCTIGDFNVITSTEEKYGGIPYNMNKSLDFISTIEASGLVDIGYSGQHYTWCNQRAEEARVWKRLDRAMVNDKWLELMPQTTITHLPSVGSYHCPLLMEMEVRLEHKIKVLAEENLWESYVETTAEVKLLASTLSTWSKKEYGNIFSSVINFEEQLKVAEEDVIQQNTEENRTKLHLIIAQYIKYLKLEASILKQKTQLQWFKEGDTNSKYFHSIMRGRRRNLFIHEIGHEESIREEILNCIPRMVTEEQNQTLQQMPNLEELTQVVFSMNPNSTAGPDGFGGKFYQHCWEIIKEDVLSVVQYFFCGYTMPKFISHACLPPILPQFIFENQSSFVKGRSISENIMIAQEITHGIKNPNEGDNVRSHWFQSETSPITYLGCPLYIGGQRIIYYSDLVAKITRKIFGWQSRMLSFGGKATMVKHVLQSIPIHTMSAISPPKTTIRYMKRAIADFFLAWDKEKRKYHWASWDKLSLPYDEGGIGVTKLEDICTSLQFKQWWIFRIKQTLWGQFLRAKYCQRAHPVAKKLDTGQSLVWNFMMKNKGIAEA
ncbi:uncharacterized protein LOC125850697 [Solanum stenotomum]|uniref:uncharacterized protein LOC125850697 n=1 Tax=Solanum stenotomum TaxID=172797 RepID=UPI0020D1A042|nr:uncharacterized protein LOC125850697 [Solanum stenotomum]